MGYRLAMTPQYQKAESLQAYKGPIARLMVKLNLAFRQQFIDDQGRVGSLAINKKSLSHYNWRHNYSAALFPEKYSRSMKRLYKSSHQTSSIYYKNNQVLIKENSRLLCSKNIFKKDPISIKDFVKSVQEYSPVQRHFYKIQKEGETVGYLLGTFHLGNELIANLNPKIEKALNKSKTFAAECEFNLDILKTPKDPFFYNPKEAQTLEPKKLTLYLGVEGCLLRKIKNLGSPKKLVGLETEEELDHNFHLIGKYVKQQSIGKKFFGIKNKNIPVYAEFIQYLTGKGFSEKDSEYKFEELVKNEYKRNHLMAERAMEHLQRERTFIAVGYLHLHGINGMENLFACKGYSLKKV